MWRRLFLHDVTPDARGVMVRDLLTFPTWERYTVLSHAIAQLSVRDRRQIFQLLRLAEEPSPDLLFPAHGFTLSEFAVWHVLGETGRKTTTGRK